MPRTNQAYTMAYEVITTNDEPTVEEHLAAIRKRIALLESSPDDARDLCSEAPFDTYDMDMWR